MIYVAAFKALLLGIIIYNLQKAWITALKWSEAPIKVLTKYSNFSNIFSNKKALILLEQTNLNKYTIKLKDDKQPSYEPVYSMSPVKLKIFKTYIETALKIGFI